MVRSVLDSAATAASTYSVVLRNLAFSGFFSAKHAKQAKSLSKSLAGFSDPLELWEVSRWSELTDNLVDTYFLLFNLGVTLSRKSGKAGAWFGAKCHCQARDVHDVAEALTSLKEAAALN